MSAKRKAVTGDPMPEEAPSIANVEMERALLGCLITNNVGFERIEGLLKPEDFFEAVNGRIYETAAMLVEQNRPVSPLSIGPYLKGNIDLGELTVPQYIVRLGTEATPLMNVSEYAKELKRLAQRRQMVEVSKHMQMLAPDLRPDQDVNEIIDSVTAMLEEIKSAAAAGDSTISMKDALKNGLQAIAEAYQKGEAMAGMSTGLTDLDAAIGGLAPSNVIVLAARPAMGKTAMAMGWMSKVAERHPDRTTLFFSQEMSATDIALRAISEVTGVPVSKLRSGDVTPDLLESLVGTIKELGEKLCGVEIVQDSSVKLSFIRAQCRKWHRKRPLALICIDYIQLMKGPGEVMRHGGNRNEQLSAITAGLKSLAKEFDVPVVLLSQLSRKCEERDDKRPQLADLRESGSIEQDADAVVALYREEYYLRQSQPKEQWGEAFDKWKAALERWQGIAEVLVLKNRHGSTDTVMVGWSGKTTSFRNLSEEEKERAPDEDAAKRIYINKPFQDVFQNIRTALKEVGQRATVDGVPSDRQVTTTTECFETYLKAAPILEGDDPENVEKQARKEFKEAINWLTRSGVVGFKQIPGEKKGWVWMTDKKVKL